MPFAVNRPNTDQIFSQQHPDFPSNHPVPLPDGGVEAVRAGVALGAVKIDGLGVGFGDGEGDLGDAQAHEMEGSQGEQQAGQAAAAVVGMNADLGDMAAVRAYARAQHQGRYFAVGAVDDDKRDRRGECAAAGVADDVVEKAQGAFGGAVLVVDHGVRMIAIGLVDEAAGGDHIVIAPWAQFQAAGQLHAGRAPETPKGLHHEEAAEDLESRLAKELGMGA